MSKTKRTVIFTDYKCNNNCLFCLDSAKRGFKPKTTREIRRDIQSAKKNGTTYLEFIGGEFTIRPDSEELLRYAEGVGFENLVLVSNGRMLSYFDYAKKVIEAGLTSIVLSIHGHNAKLHDALTQSPGSFSEIQKTLANLKKLKFSNIGANTTIVKQNYKQLKSIGLFLHENNIQNAEFIFVDPNQGRAKTDFKKLVPRVSDMAPFAHECLDLGKKHHKPHWHIRYVPLCYFADYLDQVSELDEVKHFKTEHVAPDFMNNDVEGSRRVVGRIKPEKCRACKLYDRCEGIWAEYLKRYGDGELKPL